MAGAASSATASNAVPSGDPLCSSPSDGDAVQPPALEPGLDQVVVVVAGHDHQLAPGERLADPGQGGGAGFENLGQGAVAELEHVAEQDEPVDVLELGQEQLPEALATRQVATAAEPEVEVGDHRGAHAGMVPTVADATTSGD